MRKLLTVGLAFASVACSQSGSADTTSASTTSTALTPPTTAGESTTTTPTTPETTSSSTSASAETSTTSSTATTTPSTDDETISPAGFWQVRVGETLAENEARIGFPFDDVGGDPTSCVVLQLPEVGGIYFIASTLTGEPADDRGDLIIGRVSSEAAGWTTDTGIEVGMSVDEAVTALGDTITERRPHAYVDGGEYLIIGPEDARYIFETDGETITAMHAGMEPVVSYVEACS
jgi:hypothetical protein